MVRRYCFSCGSSLPREEARPGAVCQPCRLGGPQVPASRVRFEVRTRDGGTRGPLSRDALVDQLLRGAIAAEDQVTGGGARWKPLVEHPDFVGFFIPGTPDYARLHSTRKAATQQRRTDDGRRFARTVGAVGAMAASLGLTVYAVQNDLFIVPEELVNAVMGAAGDATSQVADQIEQAVDQDAAKEAFNADRTLPGGQLLTQLAETWPQPTGAPGLRLHRGRVALWSGTVAGLAEAREHLEQAAILAPADVEVWGSLAETWARTVASDPSLVELMSIAADRARAISDRAPAARRASAAIALATGNAGRAADLLTECGEPASLAGTRGSTVDLGCAVMLAEVQGNEDALATLDERLAGVLPIRLALARVHEAEGRYGDATALLRKLTAAWPNEPEPWRVLFRASVAIGDWKTARQAGEKLSALAPHLLVERARLGAIHLKVRRDGGKALAELEAVIAHEGFSRHPDRIQVFSDAAAAAIDLGRLEQALAFADQGLAEVGTHPVPSLQKARALQLQGRSTEAEKVLRGMEPGNLSGHALAQYHLGAARIYVDAGRERLAETELTSASEADPGWGMVLVESARNRLMVGNRDAAMQLLEQLAFMDLTQDRARAPLSALWLPEPDWRALQKQIDRELVGDARFANRGVVVMGVLGVLANSNSAPDTLRRGLRAVPDSSVANAAMGQFYMMRNDPVKAGMYAGAVIDSSANLGVVKGVEGWAAGMTGDAPSARAFFVQALQDAPNAPGVHRWRAQALIHAGDVRGARRSLAEALRLAPDDVQARALLASLEG